MSLINNMLQNLEKRHASLPERGGVARHVRVLPATPDRRIPTPVLGGIGLALIAATAWYMHEKAPQPVQPAPAPVPAAAAATAESSPPRIVQPERAGPPESIVPDRRLVSAKAVVAAEPSAVAPAPPKKESALVLTAAPASAALPSSRTEAAQPAIHKAQAPPQISLSLRMDAIPVERIAPTDARAPTHSGTPQIDRKVRELTPSQLAENEYRMGASLLNQGRPAEAQERFIQALRHAPSHVGARQALFGVLVQAKRTAEAEQVLQDALKINSAQPGFAMALARIQVDRGDTVAATETLQNAVHAAQGSPDYLAFMAALLQRQGRHAHAVEMYQGALALAPRSGLWLMGLGLSFQALNRNGEAQDAFRRARASDGLSADLQAFVDQRLKQLQ